MRIYYHFDGSQTISRERTTDKYLMFEAVRVVWLNEDGSIVVVKDRYGNAPRTVVEPLPLEKRA